MNNPNCWRVPTPTDINNIQEFTALERAIFREILALCQSKDTLIHFIHNDRHYQVELKRGQCIFRVSAFAKDLNLNRQKVRGSLSIISKWYSQLDIQGMPYGLVITVKNYDEIIKMNNQDNNQVTIKEQSSNNQGTPNKNGKSVESDKSIKETIPKGIGEAPFKVNETLKSKPKDKRNPQVTEIVGYLKEKIGRLDDTDVANRRNAYNLIRRLKKDYPDKDPVATAKALIDIGLADEFHSKNLTNFRYVFNNQQKILRTFKAKKNNVYILR
jgi:hypothetical protein